MRITKFGHSCLLVEEKGARILIDPGVFSNGFEELTGLDAVLITQEHPDHYNPDYLYTILGKNPQATVITNSDTAELVKQAGIPYRILDNGQTTSIKDIPVKGFGMDHAIIHPSIPVVRNTGYLLANKLFHPGDSYTIPTTAVEILAMPVGGPWLKISDTIDYAIKVKPKIVFPIHDGMFNKAGLALSRGLASEMLPEAGIEWVIIEDGESKEL